MVMDPADRDRLVRIECDVPALKELLDAKLDAHLEHDRAFELGVSQRLLEQNEWRGALGDQGSRMLTRDEYQSAHQALIDRLTAHTDAEGARMATIERSIAQITGASLGAQRAQTLVFALLGAIVAVVGVVLSIRGL